MATRFETTIKLDSKVKRAARIAMTDVMGLKPGERVLIITNPDEDVLTISHALYDATLISKGTPILVVQPVRTQMDLAEDSVIKAIQSNPDVVISISHKKLGKDRFGLKKLYSGTEKDYDHIFRYLLEEKKIRSFWSPSVSLDMFKRTVPISYQDLRRRVAKLKRVLDASDHLVARTAAGMDIKIGLKGRKARRDDGDFRKPGRGGNLPSGEVYVSPELGNSEGTIVFDGSMATGNGELIIQDPVEVEVEEGFAIKIKGKKEARVLRKAVKRGEQSAMSMAEEGKFTKVQATQYARNARNLGEFGIGLNPKAKIVGNILEDEKVFGTCHIALGSNYDEDAKAMIHLDGIIYKPTITAYKGGKPTVLMKRGKLEKRFL
ncbi:MAG: peptidase M17 [Methanomassiliicoccales archaeon]|nr:MAG: peptidase M17 [Methanomassiliicoccales archaeon]